MDYLKQNLVYTFKKLYKDSIVKMLLLSEEHVFELNADEHFIERKYNTSMNSAHTVFLVSVMSLPILFLMALFGVISGYHFICAASVLPLMGFVFYASSCDD